MPADELPPSVEGTEAGQAADDASEESPTDERQLADKKPKRSRRKRKAAPGEAVTVEPDSSPMVERPADEEPPIGETEAPAEPKPKARRSRKKAADFAEPAPPEAPPAETSEEKEDKPKRRSRAKKKPADADAEAAPVPTADNDANGEPDSGEPRRGWWQRTFG
jgi:ribonuclease E